MAPQNPHHRHPPTTHRAITLHGLHGILRTSRHITATWRKHGRERPLIPTQQQQHGFACNLHTQSNKPLPSTTLPARPKFHPLPRGSSAIFWRITSNARLTSASSTENSTVRTEFFGLITTSTAGPGDVRLKRTASRNRRFMRFRSTAPPSARPTVKPTRIPSPSARRK